MERVLAVGMTIRGREVLTTGAPRYVEHHVRLQEQTHGITVEVYGDQHDELTNRLQITWPSDWPQTGAVDFVYGWGARSPYTGTWSEITFGVEISEGKVFVADQTVKECIRKLNDTRGADPQSAKKILCSLLYTLSNEERDTPLQFEVGLQNTSILEDYNAHFADDNVFGDIADHIENYGRIILNDDEAELMDDALFNAIASHIENCSRGGRRFIAEDEEDEGSVESEAVTKVKQSPVP
tara:strand:+ start:199 stop:915 length:717 start_codon:yes stop_codon:yes gene_type:complete